MLKVTCAIIEHNNRVLVTQRSEIMQDALRWEFPGGKIEDGETEKECLVREIKEELSIRVLPLQRLTPVVHRTATKTIQLIPFICSFEGGDLHLHEHSAYEWASYSSLSNYTWCLPDVPVVEEYIRLKQSS